MESIVKFKSDTGVDVQVTAQDVRSYICPRATDSEIAMFLELCKAQRLNPWIKDAYLVKYGDKPAQIITGKETFSKRAKANKAYKGFKAGVIVRTPNGGIEDREGSAYFPTIGETLLGGWCRVFVEGMEPVYNAVSFAEYSTGKSLWQTKPATMIRKVAYVQCLREAFPDDFQQMYDAAEMGHSDYKAEEIPVQAVQAEVIEPTYEVDHLQPIRDRIKPFAASQGIHITDAMQQICDWVGAKAITDLDEQDVANACQYMENVINGREYAA